ncbi:hypothetical protein RJT34_16480 [Clitoria ternatea]|uniref:Uncharacterized protein n=1 Tax=Clitoria ternatea TaxID=43366 RepID=A0AAN9J773_CLITE
MFPTLSYAYVMCDNMLSKRCRIRGKLPLIPGDLPAELDAQAMRTPFVRKDVGVIKGTTQRKEELPHLRGLTSTTQVLDNERGECFRAFTLRGRPTKPWSTLRMSPPSFVKDSNSE